MNRKPYNRGNKTGRQPFWHQLRFNPRPGTDKATEFRRILTWMKMHDHPSHYCAWDGRTRWRQPRDYLLIRVEDQGRAALMRVLFEEISQ